MAYTPDYSQQYQDILSRLNTAFTKNPTSDDYTQMDQGKQLLAAIAKAQQYGVDPSQLEAIVNNATNATGSQATYDLRRGQTSGQALNGALSALGGGVNQLNSLLQLPGEKYQQDQATQSQLADERAQRQTVKDQILASIPGLQNQLGDQLLTQQQQAYTRMAPQIEQRLNALGLLQSGALPEANAKYQAQLEEGRQNQLANFGLAANQRLNVDFPLEGLTSDIGLQRDQLNNGFQLDLANITRNFQNQDMSAAAQLQKDLSLQALDQARSAQRQQSNSAWAGLAGTLGGAAIGSLGGPAGAAIGSQLGSTFAKTAYPGTPDPTLTAANQGYVIGRPNNGLKY